METIGFFGNTNEMEIYLLRHGIAEEPVTAAARGLGDAARKLTEEGRGQAALVAKAFRQSVESLDMILHSSLHRARETAAIFAREFPGAKMEEAPGLRPQDEPAEGADLIAAHAHLRRLMIVGHEPHLSHLTSLLLTGNYSVPIVFPKAAVAALEWGGVGGSRLLFLAPPKVWLA